MQPHLHLGVIEGVTIFATVLLLGVCWRVAAMKMGDTPTSRAMLLAY